MLQEYKTRFFDLALRKGNLSFGSFTLKSGRISPYFFNAGGFDDGASLSELAACYAAAIIRRALISTCCSARPTRVSPLPQPPSLP